MRKAVALLIAAVIVTTGIVIAQVIAYEEDEVTLESLMAEVLVLQVMVDEALYDIDDVGGDVEDVEDLCEEILDLLDP